MRARIVVYGGLTSPSVQWGTPPWDGQDNPPELFGEILGFSGHSIQFLQDSDSRMYTINTTPSFIHVYLNEASNVKPTP